MRGKDQFERDGYVIISQLLSTAEFEVLDGIVDRIYGEWYQRNQMAYVEQNLINMHSLTHPDYFSECPEERIRFFEFLASPRLTTLLDDMFGEGVSFHNTQLFFNPSDDNKAPYWHRDLQYSPVDDTLQAQEQANMVSLHVRIPLVAEKGVELIPGTHLRWDTPLERDVRFGINGCQNSDELPGSVLVELWPGDILIFSAQMLHRGRYRLNKKRKALDICVGKPHPLTIGFLDPANLPTDQEVTCIRNNQWYTRARKYAAIEQSSLSCGGNG